MNKSPERKRDNLKKAVKEKWKTLTEEDFKKADGSMFKLYGVILTKLSAAKKFIKKKRPEDQK